MQSCKPISTPLEQNVKYRAQVGEPELTAEEARLMAEFPYASLSGSVMYLMLGSRPDLAFAVGMLSQFLANPAMTHWQAMRRLFRYIKATEDWGLLYEGGSSEALTLMAFSDADWAGDPDSRRSISSFVFLLAGCAISWSSKRQPTVALSSTEAEYKSLTEACKEAVWAVGALAELNSPQQLPMHLSCDNQSAIALSQNPRFHARTKHLEVQHHFIREQVANGLVQVVYCPTDLMTADVLTKALSKAKHLQHAHGMGLRAASGLAA